MKQKLRFVIIIAAIILILDHLTKWLIVAYVPQGSVVSVIQGVFDIVHGRNTGAAFGFLSNWDSSFRNLFFYAVGLVALVFLYFYIKSVSCKDRFSLVALGFILGGALGNILDRFFRGSVVDFLSVHYYNKVWEFTALGYDVRIPLDWPAFNVADSAISVAVLMLIFQNIRPKKVASYS